jgi:hypothetical protein
MQSARLHFLQRGHQEAHRFRFGVSLHSHTMHSGETMAPLPRYLSRIPVIRGVFRVLEQRYQSVTGKPFDYSRAFWTPPLPAQEAFAVERGQIEDVLGLEALVSLTDHDNILASTRLQLLESARGMPVGLEWTIPREQSFLHIGVHNLPPSRAQDWVRELNSFTCRPSDARLGELLALLNEDRDTLVVLNHPLWDEPRIGGAAHLRMIREFLRRHGRWMNALEINGLRPWHENEVTIRLARALGYPVVSGGDRHGSAANTVLNLTHASSFSEFAAEIREDYMSTVLVTPQYDGPHALRYTECALDIVRDYPELAGRRRWMDRAFYRQENGSAVPLSAYWGDGDRGTGRWLLSLTHPIHSRPFRYAVRAALAAYQVSSL